MADQILSMNGKNAVTGTGVLNLLSFDYIVGLKMLWVSNTALTVTTGAACRPSDGLLLQPAANIAKTGLSLTANTWYHVYLWLNGASPDIEIVTTAPAAAYFGTARAKTGDTSRRYIGSVLTDASGNIFGFIQNGNRISWIPSIGPGSAPFRILSSGTATTNTVVAGSAVVPATSMLAQLRIQNNGTASGGVGPGAPYSVIQTTGPGTSSPPGLPWVADIPTGTDQSLVYSVTSGGQLYIDVLGYTYER